ncbi:MAG: tetratricopeptide repeat protein [Gammaproteobacteria bacterium]
MKNTSNIIRITSIAAALSLTIGSVGCSSISTAVEPQQPPTPEPPVETPKATTAKAPKSSQSPKNKPSDLSGDVLYKLMVAEIAGQRGEIDLSIENYVDLTQHIKDPALAERATRIMIYARKDKEALNAAKLWVKYDPENMEAHQVLTAMHIRNGQSDEAFETMETILQKHPEDTGNAMQMLANFLNKPEDKETALNVMDRLMATRQNDKDAMFAYGLLTLRSGDNTKAKSIIEKVTKLAPEDENYQLVYIGVLEKEGSKQAAFQYLEGLLEKNPDSFDYRIAHARLLADLGRYDEARDGFKALTVSHPESTDAHYALGLLNLQTNHAKEAKEQFEYMISKQILVNESSYYLGQIAEFEKDLEGAITWYEAIGNTSPNYFDAQIKIAITKARLGKPDEARAILTKIQPYNQPQKIQLTRVETEILIEEGKLEEAKLIFDEAIGNDHDPDLLYSRAMLAEKMGRLDLFEKDLKLIIKHNPNNADVLNALGYTLADRTDRYAEAHDLIKKALDLSPDNFYILDSMGWVLYRLGKLEESVKYLRKAKELNDDPEVSAHLGEVLWVKGDKKEAREILNSALKTTPEDEKLLEVLKRMNP